MGKVILTYDALRELISESIYEAVMRRGLLRESQESKSIDAAKKLYLQRNKWASEEKADKFVRITLREYFPVLRSKEAGKFILGVTRMFLDDQITNSEIISHLNSTLKLVASPKHINEYDRNLNGMSAGELIREFTVGRWRDLSRDKQEMSKEQYVETPEYKIIPINSFEEIHQYAKYNDWCLAQDNGEDMYDYYTANGQNQLYLILRNGFENEPRKTGPDTPYDSYGLSMMTVIVDPDGQMVQSTTRWNHENGSSDQAFTPKTMSDIIGRNFYGVFKPNVRFWNAVADAKRRLNDGEQPEGIFHEVIQFGDGYARVEMSKKQNILTPSGKIMFDRWFDGIKTVIDEGFLQVFMKSLGWNFIDTDGRILTEKWFMETTSFENGFAVVRCKNGRLNLINTEGMLVSNIGFDNITAFSNGFSAVRLNNKGWNLIDTRGRLLFDAWFDGLKSYGDGFVGVKPHGEKWTFINTMGQFLTDMRFDEVGRFNDGFAPIKINGKGWNFLNTEGRLLTNTWFDVVGYFNDGFALIKVADKGWNFISPKGRLLTNTWFDMAANFIDGFAAIKVNDKGWNFISTKGRLLSNTWFKRAFSFQNGFAIVISSNGVKGHVDREGKFTPIG